MPDTAAHAAASPARAVGTVPVPAPGRVVVLGIGNSLLADDGVGVHAIRCLREAVPGDDIEWLDAGTLNFSLLQYLDNARALIVIDAAELHAPPGTVRVFQGAEMDQAVGAGQHSSVHEAGLADLMTMARFKGCLPEHRALISVQPQRIDWGDELSPPVAAALSSICEQARLLALRWAE